MLSLRASLQLAAVSFIAVWTACAGVQEQTPLMKAAPNINVTAQQLRFLVNGLVVDVSNEIEVGASEVIAATDDRGVVMNALKWKATAIPKVHLAGFHMDPLGSLADLWIFCEQMLAFFESGKGKDLFGAQQPIAIKAAKSARARAVDVFKASSKVFDPARGNEFVTRWAVEHPIESLVFTRNSPEAEFVQYAGGGMRGGLGAVVHLGEMVHELMNRVTIYGAYTSKAARWEAQLAVHDLLSDPRTAELFANADSLAGSMSSIESHADALSEVFVDFERVVAAQTEALTDVVDEELAVALDRITEERVAILEALQAERAAVSDDVNATVDRVFLRAAQLLGGFMLAVLIVGLFLLRVARRG